MPRVDLLIHSAAQLVTCAAPGGPKRGEELADPGLIEQGAVAVSDGLIVAVGPTDEVRAGYPAHRELDATGKVVCPGFVDCHTHLVFGGERTAEFEAKLRGATYLQLLQAGGGILSTVRATRAAPPTRLLADAHARLDAMLRLGTTTVEAKSGYGLETAAELELLRVVDGLARRHACDLVPTFMGAHAVPPEYAGRAGAYVDLVVEEMIPHAAAWYAQSHLAAQGAPFFCDAFCEVSAFDLAQCRRVLEAGSRHGMMAKLHADEFNALGGVLLAIELQAASVDHLDVTPPQQVGALAACDTVAVLLPAVNFHLGSTAFADARGMISGGVAFALATDFNPGSAPCLSLPFVMALACRYQRLLPAEALNACTINAAHALRLGGRVGSLEEGKQADLLVLDLHDYRQIAYWLGVNPVESVIKRGRIVL
jgi:imidazolonepropionase